MVNKISLETALENLDKALSTVTGNRETHIVLIESFNIVRDLAIRPVEATKDQEAAKQLEVAKAVAEGRPVEAPRKAH